jgi:hypothetical protein
VEPHHLAQTKYFSCARRTSTGYPLLEQACSLLQIFITNMANPMQLTGDA